MAELAFFSGTMDTGKSTLALQTDYNHRARGRVGLIFTSRDRAGEGLLSSRLGLTVPAIEVNESIDFWQLVVDRLSGGDRLDYLICDEVTVPLCQTALLLELERSAIAGAGPRAAASR